MRNLLIAALTVLSLAGCGSSSSGDDNTVHPGSGEAMNKPKTEEDTARDAQMKQAGNSMNDARAQGAAAEAAAKAKSGGK